MFSYLVVFATVVTINVIPVLMPPTWIVLASLHHAFGYDAFLLALVGAIASTTGRFLLTYIGTFFRRFANTKRKKSMDALAGVVNRHPVKSFGVTFLYALSPLPSNIYFATLGIAKSRPISVMAGFFLGRLISYYTLIVTSQMLFMRLDKIIESRLLQIAVVDIFGIIVMLIVVMIDWNALIRKKKLKILPIKFWG